MNTRPIAPLAPTVPIPRPTVPQPTTARPAVPQPTIARPAVPQPTTARPAVPQPTTARPTVPQPTIARPAVPQPPVPQPQAITPQGTIPQPAIARPTVPHPTIPQPVPAPQLAQRITTPPPERQTVADDYYPQDQPRDDEFQFNAGPENSDLIQATIQTARDVFPSLETFIRVAERLDIHSELRRRSRYPSYMKDASTYEITRIYQGPAAVKARELIALMDRERYWGDIKNITREMNLLGYSSEYMGLVLFVKKGVVTVNAGTPLTPENFVKTITPDKAILMEAWREKVANGSATEDGASNLSILGLGEIVHPNPNIENVVREDRGIDVNRTPLIFTLGFSNHALREAIARSVERLPDRLRPREETGFRAKRKYIMYDSDRKINKMQEKYLPLGKLFPKSYYMMVYNELMIRGLII